MGLFPDANIKLLFAIHTCCAECMVQMEDKTKQEMAQSYYLMQHILPIRLDLQIQLFSSSSSSS